MQQKLKQCISLTYLLIKYRIDIVSISKKWYRSITKSAARATFHS